MDNFVFDLMQHNDFENMYFCQEKTSGLKAVIAIHDTTLGPAAGGIRMWPYASERDAIQDAARLARAMTYKWAAAGIDKGGGKCVVMADPKHEKTEVLLRRLGRFIQRLNGVFLAGADVGTTVQDMDIIAQESSFIVPASEGKGGSGDSGPATASGVVQGMRACLNALFASPDLRGRTVAVQGVGSVGKAVIERLVQAGAIVTIADIDTSRAEQIAAEYSVHLVHPDEIAYLPVDIFCPCALGAVLNNTTVPRLQCQIVCGSANNQLAEAQHAEMLTKRGILYAPDYIVNAGGALWSVDSLNPGGFNRQRAETTVAHIYETTTRLIELAHEQHIPTAQAADLLAEQRIAAARGKSTIHAPLIA
ncbi:MAG: Glu/Leu/Phe/Val dehydrogenase [Ktedonobacteraceae bacterium]|nr:Glu/Leu/Phe/Val dehydrogenase [Ktedonobacteraceae bacterium]